MGVRSNVILCILWARLGIVGGAGQANGLSPTTRAFFTNSQHLPPPPPQPNLVSLLTGTKQVPGDGRLARANKDSII